MNVKQLGTGTVHLGYFFLLAALAGVLAYIISATVKPIEAAWLEARRRYAIREWEDDSGIVHVTKLNIFWAFARRHLRIADIVHDHWEDTKLILSEEEEVYIDRDEIAKMRVLRRFVSTGARSTVKALGKYKPSIRRKAADTTSTV